VLEALLEFEISIGANPEVNNSRLRSQEYLLDRHLFRRKSTGEMIEFDRMGGGSWSSFAYPTWWHYDVLRGLDYLRKAGLTPDERVKDAVELVLSKHNQEGRWNLETYYPGKTLVELNQNVGQPDRWITLKALRVLDWYSTQF